MAGHTTWTRRRFLGAAGALAAVGACTDDGDGTASTTTSSTTPPSTLPGHDFGQPEGEDPFTLGVASGDPDDSSVVLWTRVDRTPQRELLVEVALDEAFSSVIQRGEVAADPTADLTVRTLATALRPDTVYWYRFAMDGHLTPPARTRTSPAPGTVPAEPLTVAHLSCMRRSSGFWVALDDVAAQSPDLVVHCGDYIYESETGSVRPDDTPPPADLDGYRARWRRYKAGPELQAAHRVAPWLMVWDDHEVANNYQGLDPDDGDPSDEFTALRAAAYRAWWEYTPTRVDPPAGASMPIHRTVDWGGLTRFVLLDTRQHRDDQPCGEDLGPRCDETSEVTMLGADQERWFDDVAPGHDAIWTTIVQQVVVHQWRFVSGNGLWNLDQWDGYTGARDRLLATLSSAPSPVVLTGDVHSSWVSDLRSDFDDDDSDAVGVEFVAPGVSSGVPDQLRGAGAVVELSSPHIRWSETRRRGWVLHTISADEWTAEYRLVDDATVPDSSVRAVETWRVAAGARTVG
ncbi:MAG: alkaline phosphatase D family protein [Acidimicrobiales bacterium]|nr:alkaline phosphatase D family protein [Acidimicrobiales bacterium]